jgi:putative Ca2+/H+ antiporter (TMEM165/GDT1 family)
MSKPGGGASSEELDEAESAVRAAESRGAVAAAAGGGGGAAAAAAAAHSRWRGLYEAGSLVFLAEFGDRSMFSVMALSATPGLSPVGVAVGATAAHAAAAAIAVLGGAAAGRHVSERVVHGVSGALLLVFAAAAALGGA